jgi:hypothetical protein
MQAFLFERESLMWHKEFQGEDIILLTAMPLGLMHCHDSLLGRVKALVALKM